MSAQASLFDGATASAEDNGRLSAQLERVRAAMEGAGWVTLEQLHRATGDPAASISARIRDLRKAKFGARQVDRQSRGKGLYEYRLCPRTAL